MRVGLAWARLVRGQSRQNTASVSWMLTVVRLLNAFVAEGRTLAVELRRREWGRLGGLLKRHPWAKKYRAKNFFPVFDTRVVKRWLEKPGGRRLLY